MWALAREVVAHLDHFESDGHARHHGEADYDPLEVDPLVTRPGPDTGFTIMLDLLTWGGAAQIKHGQNVRVQPTMILDMSLS